MRFWLAVLGFTINDVASMTAEDVRVRYRARAKACHPDRAPRANEREARSNAMIRVRLAYESVMKNLGVMRDGDYVIGDGNEALDPFDTATLAKYFDGAERVFVNSRASGDNVGVLACVKVHGGLPTPMIPALRDAIRW